MISVLLAIYHPNWEWLDELLHSLNEQTYPNLTLDVLDDSADNTIFLELQERLKHQIVRFPYRIRANDWNCGSNKTFESLTKEACGEYLAYCDQDDIWRPNKIAELYDAIEDAQMAYCDMSVIGPRGESIAPHLKSIRPRLQYVSGDHLEDRYAFANCTAGCSMLIRRDIALAAVPFPADTVYDQWLCLTAAHFGKLVFLPKTLVRYRQHADNQTGILSGIKTKEDYYKKRVLPAVDRVEEFNRRFGATKEILSFAEARQQRRIFEIWKYRRFCKKDAYFEIAMKFIPERLFRTLICEIRR